METTRERILKQLEFIRSQTVTIDSATAQELLIRLRIIREYSNTVYNAEMKK